MASKGLTCSDTSSDRFDFAVTAGDNRANAGMYKLYSALRYVSVVLYALFSALLFCFFFIPIARFNSPNSGILPDSIGSIYTVGNGILRYDFVVSSSVITFYAVAGIAIIYAVYAVWVCANGKFAVRSEKAFIGASFAGNVSSVFYMVYITCATLGFVILGRLLALDDGRGVLSVEPCVILILTFDAFFTVVSVVTVIVRHMLERKFPSLRAIERECAIRCIDAKK